MEEKNIEMNSQEETANETENILKSIEIEEEVPALPKTIIFEIGVNGQPTLNFKCDKEFTLMELVRALATIDLAIFNQEYHRNKEKAVENFAFIETWRKQMLLQDIPEMCPEDGIEMIEKLVEML